MGFFDFIFRNRKEEERIIAKREHLLSKKRKAEQEALEKNSSIEPFVFKSNCHKRYENEFQKMGLQECSRTVRVDKNKNGCSGYKLAAGVGYIVKIYNDDLRKPNMSDKPMKVVRKTDKSVELRGFPIESQTPLGWQKIDLSDYGLIVHYENGKVSKCVLHMYDRNTFIEYKQKNNEPLKTEYNSTSSLCECEQYAKSAIEAANNGNTSIAHQYGLKVYNSIISDKTQLDRIANLDTVALTLGKTMEGDYFSDSESIKMAVGITYYLLCKAIEQNNHLDPYLFVYRFSITWEYYKVFYHLFAHSEGREYVPNPFDIASQASTATYNHYMHGMQMGDMLQEPRIRILDPALDNIFNEMYSRYSTTPSEKIISLGNKYHNQIYSYLKQKVAANDLDF